MTTFLSIILLYLPSLTGGNDLCQLEVRVINLETTEGQVLIGLFDNQDDFLEDAVASAVVRINDHHEAVYTFSGMRPGMYAVSVIHDVNKNGELDSNLFSIPVEPYGFSNNARRRFSPPSFEDASFTIQDTYVSVIDMKK